jgi:formylglycine-generating enzyme required for sulfatase activity
MRLGVGVILAWGLSALVVAKPKPTPTYSAPPAISEQYVRIPAGRFEMGCVDGDLDCQAGEKPRHTVTLGRDFWMMRTEVTIAAYSRFLELHNKPPHKGAFTYDGPGGPDVAVPRPPALPMDRLEWSEAKEYCESTGGRLPTEAEWEYAARAGHPGWRYVWGSSEMPKIDHKPAANVADEDFRAGMPGPWLRLFGNDFFSDGVEKYKGFRHYHDGFVYAAPVGHFVPNDFGLYDMAGNGAEWCADWYSETYYAASPAADPEGPAEAKTHVSPSAAAPGAPRWASAAFAIRRRSPLSAGRRGEGVARHHRGTAVRWGVLVTDVLREVPGGLRVPQAHLEAFERLLEVLLGGIQADSLPVEVPGGLELEPVILGLEGQSIGAGLVGYSHVVPTGRLGAALQGAGAPESEGVLESPALRQGVAFLQLAVDRQQDHHRFGAV